MIDTTNTDSRLIRKSFLSQIAATLNQLAALCDHLATTVEKYESEPLTPIGAYTDNELPYMNFECPDCSESLCEWTACPECGWYSDEIWEITMSDYEDCSCGQTRAVDSASCPACSN